MGHEAQHALDYLKNDYFGKQEMIAGRPFTNNNLQSAGMMDPDRIAVLLKAAQSDPRIMAQLPDYVQSFMNAGYGPKTIAPLIQDSSTVRSAMGDVYRASVGNGGFRGNNPYLADQIMSSGHFAPPIGGEMDLAPHYLAKQEASLGSSDIHPDWINHAVNQAMSQYQSPMVQSAGIPVAASPWRLGVGAGAAGVGGYEAVNSYMKANPSTAQYDQNLPVPSQSPSPTPNSPGADPNDINGILAWLHKQGY